MTEKPWDEYDWERFLQEQDRKTEQYMALLEKYLDHPDRDQIIAREMGWSHLEDVPLAEIEEDLPDFPDFPEIPGENASSEPESWELLDGSSSPGELARHPLHQASFALTVAVDRMFDDLPALQNHPAAIKLATHAALGSGKLAAALSDDDIDEMGMTIAYLKRALKAITTALDAVQELQNEGEIDATRGTLLSQRVFQVRDGIISEMGLVRAAWRKRQNG